MYSLKTLLPASSLTGASQARLWTGDGKAAAAVAKAKSEGVVVFIVRARMFFLYVDRNLDMAVVSCLDGETWGELAVLYNRPGAPN